MWQEWIQYLIGTKPLVKYLKLFLNCTIKNIELTINPYCLNIFIVKLSDVNEVAIFFGNCFITELEEILSL